MAQGESTLGEPGLRILDYAEIPSSAQQAFEDRNGPAAFVPQGHCLGVLVNEGILGSCIACNRSGVG